MLTGGKRSPERVRRVSRSKRVFKNHVRRSSRGLKTTEKNSDREIEDSVCLFFGIAGFPNQEQILGDGRRWEMLRGDNHSRMRSAFEELRELHRHGALIMGDEDSSIASRCFENVGILETPQAGIRRGPKLN